jgi:hypothetical protein
MGRFFCLEEDGVDLQARNTADCLRAVRVKVYHADQAIRRLMAEMTQLERFDILRARWLHAEFGQQLRQVRLVLDHLMEALNGGWLGRRE